MCSRVYVIAMKSFFLFKNEDNHFYTNGKNFTEKIIFAIYHTLLIYTRVYRKIPKVQPTTYKKKEDDHVSKIANLVGWIVMKATMFDLMRP